MSAERAKIRLFVDSGLAAGQPVRLEGAQSHYLTRVMRLATGAEVGLFNGRDGEWLCRVAEAGRNACQLVPERQVAPQSADTGPWLAFAPLKKGPIDFLVEKAVELGASRLMPIITRYSVVTRANEDRLRANAIEAAEQCGRLSVPAIDPALPLDRLIADWPAGRRMFVLDETGGGQPMAEILDIPPHSTAEPVAFVCGPEGGFAADELDAFSNLPFATRVGLGPRILRAETAALCALACWQVMRGDGRNEPAAKAARR